MKPFIASILFLFSLSILSQAQNKMWVFFSDKGADTDCRLSHPESFLSKDAIALRETKGIAITTADLPVADEYILGLEQLGFRSHFNSRWMNAAVIELEEGDAEKILTLPFVSHLEEMNKLQITGLDEEKLEEIPAEELNYGRAKHQNDMINMGPLHEKGFAGKGVKIAVFDAGYSGADTIDVFKKLMADERVIATWDFVDNQENVYHSHSHGTQVLSTIAADLPGKMVGSAPNASFVLCRTENDNSESLVEEHNWMKAMEWVDSIGVDVIHSSLGYSTFDDPETNHTYEDLDGDKTIITRAADMAAARGIIVSTSAGNEGSGPWKYITAPCDGDSVLCTGAVDKYTLRSRFSSIGPTPDGRIKPDVVAMGTRTIVAHPSNRIYGSNGTSFSSPIIAGLAACLKQAHPDRSNMDIIQAVKLSGDQYALPDAEYGYGIPDAAFADSLLSNVKDLSKVEIAMDEKPQRGRPAKPPVAIQSSRNKKEELRASLVQKSSSVEISLANENDRIKNIEVKRGKETLSFHPDDLIIEGNKATVNTSFLLRGQYKVKVATQKASKELDFNIR
ncbi:MAG: S8 family serine peptidase [Bacteroidota bacterium]